MDNNEYIAYRCSTCGKTTILLKSEIRQAQDNGTYLTCSYNGKHKHLIEVGQYDDLNDCMRARVYTRGKHGAIKEIK
jgi:DNA-directed RNA polymerase subunit RPC12/RpoP